MLQNELDYDIIDLFWEKELVERESLNRDKVKEIQNNLWNA